MEDCCAVCAEPLEWIGYGPCGHLEVCFKCIARLRFVLDDKNCCICKQECPTVFVTKALGDRTRILTDWNTLVNLSNSSGQGSLYFDRVVEAYFDDEQPFKIIKAMCRLYCSICEGAAKKDSVTSGMVKKGHTFRSLDALQHHQYNVHKVAMCRLCLEGRKVFIGEQKLYFKHQLDQHFQKGDLEVDGNKDERGGFGGHPVCDFCIKPFYGDHELYQHMSHEHYTCRICQQTRPDRYEYYRKYDDLEAHYRQKHSLCENPECLAKKFVVFAGETELQRHNANAHGGNISRSQRNTALEAPLRLNCPRPEQDSSDENTVGCPSRRGDRGRGGHLRRSSVNGSSDQVTAAVNGSVETRNLANGVGGVGESRVISPNADESTMTNVQGDVERPNVDDREGGMAQVQGDCQRCGQPAGSRSGPLGNWDDFPAGVKFDPSDEELLHHLEAEVGCGNEKSHPLIKNFISVLDGEDGICQTHPEHLPGVRKDGSSRHFFHRPAKAYTTGTRKRRKIHSEDDEPGVETRWHKTGKTRSVTENGRILGWKKIMVLYRNTGAKKSKPQKTNWILHQYHLGRTEEETDGELVVCKVFYQKQPRQCTGGRQLESVNEMENVDLNQGSKDMSVACISEVSRGTPVTPKVDTPQRPRSSRGDAGAKVRGAPAQSSKGSELTVVGMEMQEAGASELTSTPGRFLTEAQTPVNPNVGRRVQISTPQAVKFVPEYGSADLEAYEEVSTSGKSCQTETDNRAGGAIVPMVSEQDEPHQYQATFAGDSQQPYQDDDADALRCEEIDVYSFLRDVDIHDFGSLEEPYFTNPNEDYPPIDVLTDSPPHLDSEFLMSSQEAMDVLCFSRPADVP